MSLTLWLTGLPASGKSTLAVGVAAALERVGLPYKIIDGDELRRGLCSDLGYSREDRRENIRRAAEVCRLLNSAGVLAIAALISPYRADREAARRIIGQEAFREVWLNAPLAICEQRDPKGLYRKARTGELNDFTGVSAPYEPPESPHLTLETDRLDVDECVICVQHAFLNHDL